MGDVIKVDFSKKLKPKDESWKTRAKRIAEALKRIDTLMSEMKIDTLMSEMKVATTKDTDHVGPKTKQ